ncbi:MAG: hypothetical protein Tsb0013_01290 [Phycisphaerales bacterium]
MGEDTQQVRVHFGKPFPLFPLDGVVLLPHAMVRLFIFEPRYRQMLESVLDGSGQIAMAVYDPDGWPDDTGQPALRDAVCIGQVVQHERMPDGNYRVWMQGVCRARIVDEHPPEGERMYRSAMLQPLEVQREPDPTLQDARDELVQLLAEGPCTELPSVRSLLEQIEREDADFGSIAPQVLFEIVGLSVVGALDRRGLLYRLLAEGDPMERARCVLSELRHVRDLMKRAEVQFDPEAPQGISWN